MKKTLTSTSKNRAVSAFCISARGLFGPIFAVAIFAIAGCSALPGPPARPLLYDFGPGILNVVPFAPPSATASRPSGMVRPSAGGAPSAGLPPLALADVRATGLAEGTSAILYRLAYSGSQQLRPYGLARWSQPPAQLLQQRLREALGQRRAILPADESAALDRARASGGVLPAVLRIELEEFSQLFTSPTQSTGTLRLRATLVDTTVAGDVLLGQRVFTVQTPARTADAQGGVAALAEASDQVAGELASWVEQMGR